MENLTAIEKLDALLTYFVIEKSTRVSFSDMTTRFNATPGQIREILDRLLSDGYVREFIHTHPMGTSEWESYSSTFDGRLFYESGGYNAKALADAADAEQQMLEIARLKSVDVSNDQNQRTLNKLTNRLSWATWFAFGAAVLLLGWQIYSYYHPAPIPVNVKIQTEKKP